jgi:hypothetical protein
MELLSKYIDYFWAATWNILYRMIKNYWLLAPKLFGGQEGVDEKSICSQLLGVQIKYIDSEMGADMCTEKIDGIIRSYTVMFLTFGLLFTLFQILSILKLLFTLYIGRSFFVEKLKRTRQVKSNFKINSSKKLNVRLKSLSFMTVKFFSELDSLLQANHLTSEDKIAALSKRISKANEIAVKYRDIVAVAD